MPVRATVVAVVLAASVVPTVRASGNDGFDLDTGNAAVEVVIPTVIPVIYGSVSPGANDASLVLRWTALLTHAWFDAIAPYHPTAVGISSRLERRPEQERTTRNKNIAVLHASHRVLHSLLPSNAALWATMLASAGLDPDAVSGDAVAVANGTAAGDAVVAAREHDGMNQLGDEGGGSPPGRPYADSTGYQPVNTAYDLVHPGRWQPLVVTDGNGVFRVQQFVTPQYGSTRPYSYARPDDFRVPAPRASTPTGAKGRQAYEAQADEVLDASAGLTDEQKMTAELFDDKLRGLGFSALFASQANGLSMNDFIHYDALTNLAAFDTGIAVWHEKLRHDAVRPVSAIRHLHGDRPVTAWGGPGAGTVHDLPASSWRSYLSTADHPEYPSGSAGFCAAHAQASRHFFGSDDLGWSVPFAAGSSAVEPGVTPRQAIVLTWDTWSDLDRDCGLSRLWGGVHFSSAITAAQEQGRAIADRTYAFLRAHIDGTAGPLDP